MARIKNKKTKDVDEWRTSISNNHSSMIDKAKQTLKLAKEIDRNTPGQWVRTFKGWKKIKLGQNPEYLR